MALIKIQEDFIYKEDEFNKPELINEVEDLKLEDLEKTDKPVEAWPFIFV